MIMLRGIFSQHAQTFTTALIANAVSHPLLWYAFPFFSPYSAWLLVGETGVVLIEFAILTAAISLLHGQRIDSRKIFAISLGANATSTLIGLLMVH